MKHGKKSTEKNILPAGLSILMKTDIVTEAFIIFHTVRSVSSAVKKGSLN